MIYTYEGTKFPMKARVIETGKVVNIIDGQLGLTTEGYIKFCSDHEDGFKGYKPDELEFLE